MAFEPDNKLMKKTLQDMNKKENKNYTKDQSISLASLQLNGSKEKKKGYNINMRPSIHDKAVKISEKLHYKNLSAFLDDLIERLDA